MMTCLWHSTNNKEGLEHTHTEKLTHQLNETTIKLKTGRGRGRSANIQITWDEHGE